MITIPGDRLTLALNVMKAFVPECNINVQADHIFMSAVDTANVGYAECKATCVSDISTDVAIGLDHFPPNMDGDVTIELGNPLVVHAGRANYKIRRLTGVRKPSNPKIPWTNIFTMIPSDLKFGIQTVCDAYEKKDTSAAVRITYGPNGLLFEDKNTELVDVTYNRDEITVRKEDVPNIVTLLPAEYLKLIQPVVGKLQEIIIGMGPNMPLTISGNATGLGCGWIISERVDV